MTNDILFNHSCAADILKGPLELFLNLGELLCGNKCDE